MPLGGQHITAALIRLRKYTVDRGVAEIDLQDSLKHLKGIVYTSNTPVSICRAVAGRHQSQQHNVKESSIAECLEYIAAMGAEKMQRTGKTPCCQTQRYSTPSTQWAWCVEWTRQIPRQVK